MNEIITLSSIRDDIERATSVARDSEMIDMKADILASDALTRSDMAIQEAELLLGATKSLAGRFYSS